jgi:hypothetical protein
MSLFDQYCVALACGILVFVIGYAMLSRRR